MRYYQLFAERLLASNHFGVLLVNAHFHIQEISDSVCRMFGIARESWVGRSADEWIREMKWRTRPFDRSLLQGMAFHDRALEWGEGERRRSFLLDGDVLQEEDAGAVAGAYVLFQDVSRIKLLEEQIRRSDQLKTIGQIAAGTAHEIRNPLTAIRGFMQLLEKSLSDRKMVKEGEFVQVMLLELDRINILLNEFLLLSKPRSFKRVATTAGCVLQEILPVIHSEAHLRNVVVQYVSDPGTHPIQVDKEQLKQVLLNLAKNAIEAMSEGGTLVIHECFEPDRPDYISIAIQDEGPGIPQELWERIFEPFYTTKQQGTGLGLSICRKIVHDLGGRLGVASDSTGTRFTVELPTAGACLVGEEGMSG